MTISSFQYSSHYLDNYSYRTQTPKFRTCQYKLYRIKQVALPTPIPPHDDIHFGREGMYFRLLFERTKVREGDGFDVHVVVVVDVDVVACSCVTVYLLFIILDRTNKNDDVPPPIAKRRRIDVEVFYLAFTLSRRSLGRE